MADSRSKYRKEATDGYFYSDLVDYGYDDNKEELVPQSTVESVINDIESDVDEIEALLDNNYFEIAKNRISEVEQEHKI